jgi:large subunit ribosomal protein L13
MKTILVKPEDASRSWYLIDAEGKILGRVAARAAAMLRGKCKPQFVPYWEVGDHIIIVNAEKIQVSGRKRSGKMYYRHTGYPGGLKSATFQKIVDKNGAAPLELAIKGMLPKGPLGRKMFKNVKVYSGPNHPHLAQNPVKLDL